MKIAIIGAGFVGQTIAKLAKKVGHQVKICNSRDPKTLFSFSVIEGIDVGTLEEVIEFSEFIILAVPLYTISSLNKFNFKDKIVVDTSNYYPNRDGIIAEIDQKKITVSELTAFYLEQAKIVKAFNSIRMKDLFENSFSNKYALPLVSDDLDAKKLVKKLYHDFGFEAVDLGGLKEGWRFDQGTPFYCVLSTKIEMTKNLSTLKRSFIQKK